MNPTKKTETAGGVVVNAKGLVLIVHQNKNSWSLPKGHLEGTETAQQAAEREIFEETGIDELTFVRKLGSYERYRIGQDGRDDVSELKTLTIFLFTTTQRRAMPMDSKITEARWVDKNEVAGFLTHPKDKEFFTGILKSI